MALQQFRGETIRRLMRQHKHTIRSLAKHMNITMKRVRDVRARGVTGQYVCQDWYEGITGEPRPPSCL